MAFYRFLSDHNIGGVYFQAGTTATTADVPGGQLPLGWVPTGAVEAMDLAAVSAVWAAGVQLTGKVQTQWAGIGVAPPVTRWVPVAQPNPSQLYQLTGLGAALAPRQFFGAGPP